MSKKPNVVVIGGGTGIFPVTAALKHLQVNIATIIAVSDTGGSTGRIRDEFGFQPVGDLRQSLAALAEHKHQEWIRKLLLYRFTKGDGLKGHNLGNLILTALQDMTGDTDEALYRAMQIFRLEGQVIPSTKDNVEIEIEYQDGSKLVGENYLNPDTKVNKQVKSIKLVPQPAINPYAKEAIIGADLIIIGPGDYYASILTNLLPTSVKDSFKATKAKLVYISNLMTRHHQTSHMSAQDHLKGVEAAIDHRIDLVVLNNTPIPKKILDLYAKEHEHPVKDNLNSDPRSIRADVITTSQEEATIDDIHRSYLRHDSHKLTKVLSGILKQYGLIE